MELIAEYFLQGLQGLTAVDLNEAGGAWIIAH